MQGAYGVNGILFGSVTGNGTGQTIAIVDAYDDPDAASDLNAFSAYFGLPTFNSGAGSPTFTQFNQYGSTSPATLPITDPAGPDNDDWEIEESLDIEWAHSIAPKANIDLVEGASDEDSDLYIADATAATLPGVSAVSNSWSEPEYSSETLQDANFNVTGVTYLYSTGDGGKAAGPQYPATSPDVVAVGGTTLTVGSGNTYGGEAAWNGSGGGKSQYESIPSYQVGKINGLSAGHRTEPDVSMDANPYSGVPIYDTYDFGQPTQTTGPWATYGGTSLSCPMWAGLIAIVNQGRAIGGASPLTGATQTLPDLYNLPASDFHDITSGGNGYLAGTGYDLATGIGTPIANLLVEALAPPDVTANPQSQTLFAAQDASFTTAATGTATVQWMVENAGGNSFSPVSGATSTTLDLGASTVAQSGNMYEAVFSNGSGISTTTTPATLTVNPDPPYPVIITNPSNLTVNVGQNATFSATGSGTPTPTVQWMVETPGSSSFSSVSGATSGTLNLGAATQAQSGDEYEAVFSNTSGPSATSTPATLNVLPTWITSTSAATWNPSTQILTVTGAAAIVADPGTDEPVIKASGSAAAITLDPTSGIDIHIGGLCLTNGASATVTSLGAARTITNYHLLVIGTPGASAAPQYTIDSTSTLDLADNDMAILYGTGISPLATVSAQLEQSYEGGLWNGPGLTSSVAKSMNGVTALGFGEASTLGLSTFDGLTLGGNAVLVKYTLNGDANLDGTVSGGDYNTVLNNFDGGGLIWTSGSFDYSGNVTGADFNAVLSNFDQTLANVLT
jgi:hypothetical protein